MRTIQFSIQLAALALLTASTALDAGPADSKKEAKELRPYVLPDCIVSGRKLESDALSFKYDGREIRTCCDMCMDDFFRDPENWVERIAEAEKLAAKKADKPKKPAAKPEKKK
jgi:hypothetical protein